MKKYLLGLTFIFSTAIGITYNAYAQHDMGGYWSCVTGCNTGLSAYCYQNRLTAEQCEALRQNCLQGCLRDYPNFN